MRLAFLGLGVMGYPMAGHLKKAGHDVTVYNRTGAKAERWVEEFGGERAASPAEASANADAVLACRWRLPTLPGSRRLVGYGLCAFGQ